MKVRKAFDFMDPRQAETRVHDHVSATIPDQSLSLREMMMRFAYIGTERLEEIVNRGWDGDEDDDQIQGIDIGALDYAEVHDRVLDLLAEQRNTRAVHAAPAPSAEPVSKPAAEPAAEPAPESSADA